MPDSPPSGPRACSDPLAAAAPFVGVPYRRHGDDPARGWDCRGCVAWLRRDLFGLASPGMEPEGYTATQAGDPAEVERLIAERRAGWVPVEPRPGAVLLFRYFDRDAHVGLFLGWDRGAPQFVHALAGANTTIVALEDSWLRRLRGAYDCSQPARGVRLAGAVLAPG